MAPLQIRVTANSQPHTDAGIAKKNYVNIFVTVPNSTDYYAIIIL